MALVGTAAGEDVARTGGGGPWWRSGRHLERSGPDRNLLKLPNRRADSSFGNLSTTCVLDFPNAVAGIGFGKSSRSVSLPAPPVGRRRPARTTGRPPLPPRRPAAAARAPPAPHAPRRPSPPPAHPGAPPPPPGQPTPPRPPSKAIRPTPARPVEKASRFQLPDQPPEALERVSDRARVCPPVREQVAFGAGIEQENDPCVTPATSENPWRSAPPRP
jgi:hypothetical protein